jgi:tripartite-type tricarboxylate transporter receptor subunit TctC
MQQPIVRSAFAIFVRCAALVFVLSAGTAHAWPDKTVRIIVPYPPGGGTDIVARLVAEKLQAAIGQTVLVENRAGANGIIGSEAVARAPADGHMFAVVTGTHVLNSLMMKKVPFDPVKDFAAVSILASSPMVIVAGNDQPFKTIRELVAHAKANPGKVAIGNSESATMLSGEMLKSLARIEMTQVAYKGGGLLMTDIMGGHIPLGVTSGLTALPFQKAGKLRVLGVGSKTRTASMPDVPSVAEAGVAGYEATSWYALLAPAGTPKDITTRIAREVAKIMADAAVKERIVSLGGDAMGLGNDEAVAFLVAERTRWSRVVQDAGIQPVD